jgi:hypothetical protein
VASVTDPYSRILALLDRINNNSNKYNVCNEMWPIQEECYVRSKLALKCPLTTCNMLYEMFPGRRYAVVYILTASSNAPAKN